MSLPRIVAVTAGTPADSAGLVTGDQIAAISGVSPRDVLEWQQLVDEADLELDIVRGGVEMTLEVPKRAGESLGAEVHSAIFDQVRTCDNHCEFCFIYQLPPGMRESLYLKDDDYRLSFLYGNFTTLTRFTEADLERVISEGISPLHVSIHATDPDVRTQMLRNRRGATSLRWLRALLDHGVEVHGQIVVCPDRNDGTILDDTLAAVLDEYPELASVCVVPLGVSKYSTEEAMRAHTVDEANTVIDVVEAWQETFLACLGRRLVFVADEYYLLADRTMPDAEAYEGFKMHEDGIGMARAFEAEFQGLSETAIGPQDGFFAWVDGAPADGYRAPRSSNLKITPRRTAPVGVITGAYGAQVLAPLLAEFPNVRIIEVDNAYFGGTTAVTGLLVGEDVGRALADQPSSHRYLLPDVCLSRDVFLDGTTVDDLPRHVEVIPTDGHALRRALEPA